MADEHEIPAKRRHPRRRDILRGLCMGGVGMLLGCSAKFHVSRAPAASGKRAPLLLVFVTGVGDHAEDTAVQDVIANVRRHAEVDVDAVIVHSKAGAHMVDDFTQQLNHQVVHAPEFAGYDKRVLFGFSAGGTASLEYVRREPKSFDTLLLYAPYLGPDFIVEEIRAAGGLKAWSPAAPIEDQELLWVWLRDHVGGESPDPHLNLHVMWGRNDETAPGLDLLEPLATPERLCIGEGEHGWPAFENIWPRFVREHPGVFQI